MGGELGRGLRDQPAVCPSPCPSEGAETNLVTPVHRPEPPTPTPYLVYAEGRRGHRLEAQRQVQVEEVEVLRTASSSNKRWQQRCWYCAPGVLLKQRRIRWQPSTRDCALCAACSMWGLQAWGLFGAPSKQGAPRVVP